MSAMTGKGMEVKMKEYQNALADMSNEAVEYVRGIPVVKTFGQTIFSFKRFKGAIDNYEKWVIAYTKALRLPMMGFTTAINSVFAFLIAGAIVFSRHGMTNELLLNLIFYIIITPVIGTTLTKLMFMSENNMLVADAIARMDEILNEAPLSESEAPKQPKDNSIELADVTLFNNTIMENIRLGRKDATDEEVLEAARMANCDGFARKLPDGYNSLIGENGCELSGGERQQNSIARAFLKNAPIILLDEATASLDVDNETQIQGALSKLIQDKTVLIIAHRMRTVSGADKVVVLSDGVVAEQGTPEELMKSGTIYPHMVKLQSVDG